MEQTNNNNNFSVLPFYDFLGFQNARKSYAYGNIYPLYVPCDRLVPFQIMRPLVNGQHSSTIRSAILQTLDGKFVRDISEELRRASRVANIEGADYDILVYTAAAAFAEPIPEGQYFIELDDDTRTWYSEVFTAVSDVSPYLKVEWWDVDDLVMDAGAIAYRNPLYKNVVYLNTELGKPDYEFEEEGETRDGYFFPEKQISEKVYRFNFLAAEYLCDAMRFVRLSDFVRITDKYGRQYMCDTFLLTPKWETQGDIASVEAEFHTDTVAKKIGRAYPEDWGGVKHQDFNDDFNDDYL